MASADTIMASESKQEEPLSFPAETKKTLQVASLSFWVKVSRIEHKYISSLKIDSPRMTSKPEIGRIKKGLRRARRHTATADKCAPN